METGCVYSMDEPQKHYSAYEKDHVLQHLKYTKQANPQRKSFPCLLGLGGQGDRLGDDC